MQEKGTLEVANGQCVAQQAIHDSSSGTPDGGLHARNKSRRNMKTNANDNKALPSKQRTLRAHSESDRRGQISNSLQFQKWRVVATVVGQHHELVQVYIVTKHLEI